MGDLFWPSDEQRAWLEPFFSKSHGRPRVDDRRVLSSIIFINRNGLRWRDAPAECGPAKTLYNRWTLHAFTDRDGQSLRFARSAGQVSDDTGAAAQLVSCSRILTSRLGGTIPIGSEMFFKTKGLRLAF